MGSFPIVHRVEGSGDDDFVALSRWPRPQTLCRGMYACIPGDWGSNNAVLTLSRGPCGTRPSASSGRSRFDGMLRSPLGFHRRVSRWPKGRLFQTPPFCERDPAPGEVAHVIRVSADDNLSCCLLPSPL